MFLFFHKKRKKKLQKSITIVLHKLDIISLFFKLKKVDDTILGKNR